MLPTLSTHFRREFIQERQGSRYSYQVQECPTFDCLGVAIPICAVVYDVDLRYSALGVVVVLVTLTELSVSGRGDACLKLLCSSIANFPAVFKKQRSGTKDTFQTTVSEHFDCSALCAGLVSHGWQEVCILADIAMVDRDNL